MRLYWIIKAPRALAASVIVATLLGTLAWWHLSPQHFSSVTGERRTVPLTDGGDTQAFIEGITAVSRVRAEERSGRNILLTPGSAK